MMFFCFPSKTWTFYFFLLSPFGIFHEGLTVPEWMNCAIKAQVVGQRIVIQRQNAKMRCFPFTGFSPVTQSHC